MSQANNHAYDQGPAGLVDSLEVIRAAGLASVGAGADESEALRAARFEIRGWKVAVVGIDQVLDPLDQVAGPNKPGTAAGHDFRLVLRAVRDAAASSNLVFVMIHWGVELEERPRPYQVRQAHRMIDAGADVIFGAHPHVLQPMEEYRGRPIFYSLGNLVWPRISEETSATAVAEVTVAPDGTIHAQDGADRDRFERPSRGQVGRSTTARATPMTSRSAIGRRNPRTGTATSTVASNVPAAQEHDTSRAPLRSA